MRGERERLDGLVVHSGQPFVGWVAPRADVGHHWLSETKVHELCYRTRPVATLPRLYLFETITRQRLQASLQIPGSSSPDGIS